MQMCRSVVLTYVPQSHEIICRRITPQFGSSPNETYSNRTLSDEDVITYVWEFLATTRGSILGGYGVKTELPVLRNGQ